ncbi:hypothetical protein OIE63_04845 [Streptomyces sp. NBC_01795]|uniref:hypothetical protein n=1 Tax=Streptomyces sp. NBC_01795 TaxID=2975943 RepID=UPI002DDC6C7C|nr:hypothetical protein [Streptomyces sp. NBC_01795]WSA90943.1 hypothetical protein OIE63_04845 [Streptomyces sp. NBC_01795]
MAGTQNEQRAPGRAEIAATLGIPERRVTDAVLAQIAHDPMFLHHLELCRDDPGMLGLLLGETGTAPADEPGAADGPSAAHRTDAAHSADATRRTDPAHRTDAARGPDSAPAREHRTPGNAELLGRAGTALGRWAAAGFSRTPQPLYQERLATCHGCEHLTAAPRTALYRLMGTGEGPSVCGLCGCDVRRKAALATESCPAGRWEAMPR